MKTFVLIIAGFLAATALASPATEGHHHAEPGKEHEEAAVKSHEHEEAKLRGTQVEEHIQKPGTLHPTVKCAEIVPDVGQAGPENHEACHAHCVQLEKEYRHGKCLKGICHCGLERREAVETEKVHQQQAAKGHPTVRCEHIIPNSGSAGPVNHEACKVHCSGLTHEYTHGECLDGVCHCHTAKPTSHPHHVTGKVQTSLQTHSEGVIRHPTVKCEHLVPFKGTPSAESHELCRIHCQSLGSEYTHGECSQGVCHCQRKHHTHERHEPAEGHPTVRCEHIHPITGHPGPENHEACSSHCHTIAELYLEGRCVAGICRCQTGSVVKPVSPVARPPHPEDYTAQNRPPHPELHSTGIKCGEIQVPGVVPHSENHEACLAHCHTLDKKYGEGRCHQGLCHCQL